MADQPAKAEIYNVMNNTIKAFTVFAFFLLLYNGVGAILGGWLLILDPSGSMLQLPLSFLHHSPFNSYFVPGILLFTLNGLFSLLIATIILFKWKHYPDLIFLQGCILTGWIIIQLIMIRSIHPLHLLFGGTGLLLIFLGILLHKKVIPPPKKHKIIYF